ncbi:hypothetical protein [Kordiimonas aquimaris]|uniref:hypothetical protein n=1 Tax=Kordiimonas aquimaris TaxID=707591 RepID=UPI0021CF92EA|nr:hypothetical protein [Kordiimonas aquimaris]
MQQINMEPMKWAKLPHIDDIKPLNDLDHQALSEVRDVLQKHGMLNRFGMTLLHNHFEMSDNEYLLEETDEQNRSQKITVESANNPEENTIQTMWKFSENGMETITQCVLRCHFFLGHKQRHKKEAG